MAPRGSARFGAAAAAGKLAAAAAAGARLDGMDLIAAVASKFGVANGIGLATRQVHSLGGWGEAWSGGGRGQEAKEAKEA